VVRAELEDIETIWRNSPLSSIEPKDLMLVTDFDGTLADIGPDPAKSRALPESLDAIRRLSQSIKEVVVLSSRTTTDLTRLVPLHGVRLIGDSGLPPPTPEEKRALEKFNSESARLLGSFPGVWIEIKPASTTVHLRNAKISGEEAMALLRPLIKATGLFGSQGRKVIEVHTRFGGKGTALAALLDEVEPGGVICMGDDENDRAAFELLSARSIPRLCLGVSSPEVPSDLFARCDAVLDGPHRAAHFLQLVADWASAPRPVGQRGEKEEP
jgi:trehalose 6-phosphate phosphatase